MKQTMARSYVLILSTTLSLFSGCYGMEKSQDATLAVYGLSNSGELAACGTGADIFRTMVFPYLETNCASCHGTQSPAFTTGNVDTSYTQVKGLVSFSAVNSSRIYVRSTDGHCGDPGCQKSGTEIAAAIKAWGAAEAKPSTACTNPGGTTGGTTNQGVLLRVNASNLQQILSAAQQTGLCVPYEVAFVKNGVSEVALASVQVSLTGGAIFSDSLCRVNASSVSITAGQRYQNFYVMETAAGTRTILGSIAGSAVGFTVQLTVTAAQTATPVPTPTVTPSPTASPRSVPSPIPAPTPCSSTQKMNAYAATVWPLAKMQCATCHTTGNRPQFGNATLATAYPIARGLVSIANASGSRLYNKSRDGHCGNCTATTGANFLTQMNLWFPAENTTNCSALITPH